MIYGIIKSCKCWWCSRGRGEHVPTKEFLEKQAERRAN